MPVCGLESCDERRDGFELFDVAARMRAVHMPEDARHIRDDCSCDLAHDLGLAVDGDVLKRDLGGTELRGVNLAIHGHNAPCSDYHRCGESVKVGLGHDRARRRLIVIERMETDCHHAPLLGATPEDRPHFLRARP